MCAAALEQHCQQPTIPRFAERLWQIFRRLVMAPWSSNVIRLAARPDQVMQATEIAVAESLAASLRPEAVTVRLDHDETLVPY